ncbi:MAG: DUF4142 domain-containing protein [Gemmatimonadaceae bacterium]|nr:DUF4142 domain-containing protein [Gemmatimonadaceae bacterium]NUQ94105.1 DUF4142 domain-containing protein [Gemmatimonadaceae bacterium]NUR18013.1 DUF4142 domain-containing protein [Gemmatimonadaceae bacterium]NUS98662.1 DUF4142 domain-containing protein [Gemmatimonadaceae bacterium]
MTTRHARTLGALAIAAGAALTACKGKDNYASTDTTTTTSAGSMQHDSTAMGGSSAGGTTSSAGGLTDPNIVYILDQANAADSARGKLAETKATSADVKQFARMMVGEHHALREQGQALAKKLNVTPQAPSGDQSEQQAKSEMDSLNAMAKGKAWDKAYIDYEVTYHQQVMQTATQALGAAQNAELKALIQKAAPVIQKHLDRAKEIQQKLGGATA